MGLSASLVVPVTTTKQQQEVGIQLLLSGSSSFGGGFQNVVVTPIVSVVGSTTNDSGSISPAWVISPSKLVIPSLTNAIGTASYMFEFAPYFPEGLSVKTAATTCSIQFLFTEDSTPSSTLTSLTYITSTTYGA